MTTWERVKFQADERRMVLFTGAVGMPSSVLDVAAVLQDGKLVGGSYVQRTDCSIISCSGALKGFSEATSSDGTRQVTIAYEFNAMANCLTSGTIKLTAPAGPTPPVFGGMWQQTTCQGMTVGGAIGGVYAGKSRTEDVAGMFSTLARLADDQEARITFALPYAPLSPTYMHDGKTASKVVEQLASEVATYASIRVDLDLFESFTTGVDPLVSQATFGDPSGVVYHERRTGQQSPSGPSEVFRDVVSDQEGSLRYMANEGGKWVFVGNQTVGGL